MLPFDIVEVHNEHENEGFIYIDAFGTEDEMGEVAAVVDKSSGKPYYHRAEYIDHPMIKESIKEVQLQIINRKIK